MAKSGGSNRDITFTINVVGQANADRVIDAYAKKFDELQRKANIAINAAGGGAGSGGSGGGSGSARGGTGGRGGAGGRGGSGGASSIDQDFNNLEKKWAQYERNRVAEERKRASEEKRIHQERRRQLGELRAGFGEALEGVTSLARGFVLLGVSGEENIEKALRSLAKFEAVAQMVRGTMKISSFAGKALTYGAGSLGIAAGAGPGTIGALAVAGGAGLIGGALGLRDQYNYSQTGKIGGFSQSVADITTGIHRSAVGWGIGSEEELSRTGGLYGDYAKSAASGIRGDRMLKDTVGGMMGQAQESARRLGIEREILGLIQQEAQTVKSMTSEAKARKDAGTAAYSSMNPFDQNATIRLRNRFLDNPGSLNQQQIQAIMPHLGEFEQNKAKRELRRRADKAGYFDRGWQREDFAEDQQKKYDDKGMFDPGSGIRLDKAEMQRTFVIELKHQNELAIKQIEVVLKAAYKDANDDFKDQLKKMEEQFNADIERIESNQQNANSAAANALGN